MNGHWEEIPAGGSWQAERRHFEKLARDILRVQLWNRKKSRAPDIQRAFQAKTHLGVTNAWLAVNDNIPSELQVAYFEPGRKYAATVRVSNARGRVRPDRTRDMRSLAIRVETSETEVHDLLLTNGPANHARDSRQMVVFAKAMAGSRFLLVPGLLFGLGPSEMFRMIGALRRATKRRVSSLALETYWSRAAILWGNAGPVRYLLRPAAHAPDAPEPHLDDPNYMRAEIAERLREHDVVFDLCLQRFVDEDTTPIEDGTVEWTERVSPPIPVARLTIPRRDLDTADARAAEQAVDQLAFSPWFASEPFRPLGNLNRSRKAIYAASAGHRLGHRFFTETPLRNRLLGGLLRVFFRIVNKLRPWHRLPDSLGLLNLSAFRHALREHNLHDTEIREAPPRVDQPPPAIPEEVRTARTPEGTFNDLSDPSMGSRGALFGRNFPLERSVVCSHLLDTPDPTLVSHELLRRREFLPARSLNLIAAAWIQFQVHDWVDHPRYKLPDRDARTIEFAMPEGETWQNVVDGPEEGVMRVFDNIPEVPGSSNRPPAFRNTGSHWWDASQLYGVTLDETRALRVRGGKHLLADLRLDDGYLPEDRRPVLGGARGIELTGFNDNWWLGLSAMHTLFAREHNTVCGALRLEYPGWNEEKVYQTARLVVAALIAKIHTIEWTPAILATRVIDRALNTNWSGAPREWLTRLMIWLVDVQALKGIPDSLPDHHAAPYSLTEEFVSVYRMHPLIPDDYRLCDHQSGHLLREATFRNIQGTHTLEQMRDTGLANTLYSFGIAHPGAITLHNYPHHLRNFERLNGERIDLGVVDLVRDRHRGVPRYNDFRELLRKPRVTDWEELTQDPDTARCLREIYKDIDLVDTMVGLLAEPPPENFGFSDTAFRVFILMASRRLQSDRFFTVDYRPEVYSPCGLDWVERNGMTSVILRHCPELAAVLPRTTSAFAPWRMVT